MSEPTRYFPERFQVASQFYTTGRPTYPPLLSRRVAASVGVGKLDSVLDLGTGPGFLAIDFAPLVKAVTAIDPAPEMLRIATDNAARAGVGNVRVLRGASYDLKPELGRFKLVTIGRAFHWMDRVETLKVLDALVERAGAITLFGESYPEVPANAWYAEFQAISIAIRARTPRGRKFTSGPRTKPCCSSRRLGISSGSPSWSAETLQSSASSTEHCRLPRPGPVVQALGNRTWHWKSELRSASTQMSMAWCVKSWKVTP